MIGIIDNGFVVVVLLYLFSVENNENVRIIVKLTIGKFNYRTYTIEHKI